MRRSTRQALLSTSHGPEGLIERVVASLQAGARLRDVAKREGMTPSELWRLVHRPEYARVRETAQGAARFAIEARAMHYAERALDRLAELMESDDERTALAAATAILDRAGIVRLERTETVQAATAVAADGTTLTGLLASVTTRSLPSAPSWAEAAADSAIGRDDGGDS